MSNYSSPYAKFDAHMHVLGDKTGCIELMDAANIRTVLNVSFSNFAQPEDILAYEGNLRSDTERFPGRFLYCASFNVVAFREPRYARAVIIKLSRDLDFHGAIAVKIWKDIGMMLKDDEGRYVFCDHRRLAAIFDFLAKRRVPVVIHAADPIDAWRPLSPGSPHYDYYLRHPEFHWYNKPGRPTHAEILAHRDALLRRHPGVPFLCAHLASLEYDVRAVGAFLDAHPNALTDVSGRVADLMRQPLERVREFFVQHARRVLYGTDWSFHEDFFSDDPEDRREQVETLAGQLQEHFRFFEETLALPPDVLEAFYRGNAERLFPKPAIPPL